MLPKITAIIIDDEPRAIELLEERLHILFPNIEITGKYTDWKMAIEVLKTKPVDLLFLDVNMPEKSGLDLLRLFTGHKFEIIFITAHSEFALEAIKLSAAGYVLKPIDDFELSFAVNKAVEKIKDKAGMRQSGAAVGNVNTVKIGIPNLKGIDYLKADEILYFEGINKYTKVVTREYSIMSSYNLGEFKKIVDPAIFFQVHRSYIVNVFQVRRYEVNGSIIMEDSTPIPVSKTARTQFMSLFNKITK